jgi:hypothetical protein
VAQYDRSKDRWKGEYAATNPHEYFGELTKYWFRKDRDDLAFYNPDANRGRTWLCEHDPEGCRFAEQVYGGKLDPGTPKVLTISAGPAAAESTLKSLESVSPVRVVVRNATRGRIHWSWLDFAGERRTSVTVTVEPGADLAEHTWATHAFVVTDDDGAAIATFVAPDEHALVVVTK